ncbi:MAG: GlsB/YeaQ/YmgE family stress response membrane protein [Verrucomicrobiota bacterium]
MFILGWIFFGAFIGWLSTLVMGKQSGGCLVNIALGLVGALAFTVGFQQGQEKIATVNLEKVMERLEPHEQRAWLDIYGKINDYCISFHR